jgi:hypothetical protein
VLPARAESDEPNKAVETKEPPMILLPAPAKADLPAAPPIVTPPAPARTEVKDLTLPKPDPVKVPEIDLGPVPAPAKPEVLTPPAPPAPPVATPPVEAPKPPMSPMLLEPTRDPSPRPDSAPRPPLKNAEAAHLKMLLRMGDGQPRFEIRNSASTELLLKVYGEKIEMQAPPESKSSLAGVTAIGRVRFTAPGIEGTCDHLTILSGTGELLLKGNIHLKTKKGKTVTEMTAEKMVYQIGTSGLSSGENRPVVRPASYIPD